MLESILTLVYFIGILPAWLIGSKIMLGSLHKASAETQYEHLKQKWMKEDRPMAVVFGGIICMIWPAALIFLVLWKSSNFWLHSEVEKEESYKLRKNKLIQEEKELRQKAKELGLTWPE